MDFSISVSAGSVVPITVPATSVDVPVLPGDGYLLGWSFRDITNTSPFDVEGSVVAPAAGAVIATSAATAFGNYRINWTVSLQGAAAIGDANNFGLYVGSTLIATSVNVGAAGEYSQPPVEALVTFGNAVSVKAIGAGTAGVTYSADISGATDGTSSSAFELLDGTRIVGEGSMASGQVSGRDMGVLGARIYTGLTLHVISGAMQGTVHMLFDKAC